MSFKLLRFPAFFKTFCTLFPTKARALSETQHENALRQFRHTSCEAFDDWGEVEEDFEDPETRSGGSHEDEEISCVCWHCGTRIKGRHMAGPFLF